MAIPASENVTNQLRESLKCLLESRIDSPDGGKRFSDTDTNWGAGGQMGTLASMQGLRTVVGALIALSDDPAAWRITLPHVPSLMEEWLSVVDSPDLGLRNSAPYYADHLHRVLTDGGGEATPYTDAVAWAVSTAVGINHILPDLEKRSTLPPEIVQRTRAHLATSLKQLLALQLESGGWHWGSAVGLPHGHLYFTWTAMQGLADVFDYVLGESEEQIGIGRDEDTYAVLKSEGLSETRLGEVRRKALTFLDGKYLQAALEGRLEASLLSERDEATPNLKRIECAPGDIAALYYYAYLQEALVLGGYDEAGFEGGAWKLRQMQDVIRSRFVAARAWLTNANRTRDELIEGSTAILTIRSKSKAMGRHHEYVLKDPCFWPQMVRVFVLFPYYVDWSGSADPYVLGADGAYSALLNDRIQSGANAGLWDGEAFNLSVTARAIEGLIDVLDYLVRLEHKALPPPEPPRQPADLASVIAESIFPWLENKLRPTPASEAVVPPSAPEDFLVTAGGFETEFHRTLKPLTSQISAAVESALIRPSEDGSTQLALAKLDELVKTVLGHQTSTAVSRNPDVYHLLQAMIGVTFLTVVRALPQVIQTASDTFATAAHFRMINSRRKDDPEFVAKATIDFLNSFVAQLLPPAPSSGAGAKQRGKSGTS